MVKLPRQKVIKFFKKPPGSGGVELCSSVPEGEDRHGVRSNVNTSNLLTLDLDVGDGESGLTPAGRHHGNG